MYEGIVLDKNTSKACQYTHKIMICGPSGTGKTTMANFISEKFNLDFLKSSAGDLWPKFGFKNHLDSIKKIKDNPNLGFAYQYEVLTKRQMAIDEWEKSKRIGGYVMDRSFIDMYAYASMELGGLVDDRFLDIIYEDCKKGMEDVTHIIFIPFTDDVILENNGRRVISKHFQKLVNGVIKNTLYSRNFLTEGTKIYELYIWDLEERKNVITQWLNEN